MKGGEKAPSVRVERPKGADSPAAAAVKKSALPTEGAFLDRTCKPSSVVDNDLSWPGVATGLQPPGRDQRAAVMSLCGVASGRVYIAARSPGRW